MKKAKAILVCEKCLNRNYSVAKSTQYTNKRLVLKKYCRTCNAHTIHKENR